MARKSRSKYQNISDLDYGDTVKRFERTVDLLTNTWISNMTWADKTVENPYDRVNDMLFYAARNGNLELVKFLHDDYKVDLDYKQHNRSVLANCIQWGNGSNGSSFRDVAIWLIDNGATPNIDDNDPLKAAKSSNIKMFDNEDGYGGPKEGHDVVVNRLMEEKSVIDTIVNKKQEEFYFLIPTIANIFIF